MGALLIGVILSAVIISAMVDSQFVELTDWILCFGLTAIWWEIKYDRTI